MKMVNEELPILSEEYIFRLAELFRIAGNIPDSRLIQSAYDLNVQPGSWCIPLFPNAFRTPEGRSLEIGLYREPDDGSYTLKCVNNEGTVLCGKIEIKNN